MKQIIIARKDLNMSPGKLAAQVSHASMAFLTTQIRCKAKKCLTVDYGLSYHYHTTIEDGKPKIVRDGRALYRREDLTEFARLAYEAGEDRFYFRPVDQDNEYGKLEMCDPEYEYEATIRFDEDVFEGWIDGSFVKVVCEAKNKNQLLKAKAIADELSLEDGKDYFLIRDNCLTELQPEEVDEDGVGRTLTCIGFRPLPYDIAAKISKKFQLYK